jgi:hypothetical protein
MPKHGLPALARERLSNLERAPHKEQYAKEQHAGQGEREGHIEGGFKFEVQRESLTGGFLVT